MEHIRYASYSEYVVIAMNKRDMVSVVLMGLTSHWGSQLMKQRVIKYDECYERRCSGHRQAVWEYIVEGVGVVDDRSEVTFELRLERSMN